MNYRYKHTLLVLVVWLQVLSSAAVAQSTTCGCTGGIFSFTIRYDGAGSVNVSAKDLAFVVLPSTTITNGQTVEITAATRPQKHFSGSEVEIFVNGISDTKISVSCQPPIYLYDSYGSFTLVAAESQNGSTVCCAADAPPPTITACPANMVVKALSNKCSAVADWTPPEVTGCNFGITSNYQPGSDFPVGVTTVKYEATSQSGTTSCSFTVTVIDETPPKFLSCPSDIVVKTTTCDAVVKWTEPVAQDNCSVSLSATHNSGTTFPIGTTAVTYVATDPSGNKTTCTFKVIVQDVGAPVFTSKPGDIQISAGSTCGNTASWTEPSVVDCELQSVSSNRSSGEIFSLGSTVVTYTAKDKSGNVSTASFTVVVKDVTAPVISGLPEKVSTAAQDACGASILWPVPKVLDNCSNAYATCNFDKSTIFPIGTTTVTYQAVDDAGNKTSESFDVVVSDLTAPVFLSCPSTIYATTNENCEATASWIEPLVADNCEMGSVTSNYKSGQVFSAGITTVKYTAVDKAGNTSVCEFSVIVQSPDEIRWTDCPDDIVVKAGVESSARVTWAEPQLTGSCLTDLGTSTHKPGDVFFPGTSSVVYSAYNNRGELLTCSFNVIVEFEQVEIEIPRLLANANEPSSWTIKNINYFPDNTVLIVDRFGSEVFYAEGYNNDSVVWTGQGKGGILTTTGTYFYQVRIRHQGKLIEKTGFIELVK